MNLNLFTQFLTMTNYNKDGKGCENFMYIVTKLEGSVVASRLIGQYSKFNGNLKFKKF